MAYRLVTVLVLMQVLPIYLHAVDAASTKHTRAMADIELIRRSLEIFEIDNGSLPSTEEGLGKLLDKNYEEIESYIKRIPIDPWGNEYLYYQPAKLSAKKYDLYSTGKNGVDDKGMIDDISNWRKIDRNYYPVHICYSCWAIFVAALVVALMVFWFLLKLGKKLYLTIKSSATGVDAGR